MLQEVARCGTAARARPRSSARTCTARPAPPTTRWTPGSAATTDPRRGGLDRLRHAAQPGQPRDRRRAGAADVDQLHALRTARRAGEPRTRPPDGVVQTGDWYYERERAGWRRTPPGSDAVAPPRPKPGRAQGLEHSAATSPPPAPSEDRHLDAASGNRRARSQRPAGLGAGLRAKARAKNSSPAARVAPARRRTSGSGSRPSARPARSPCSGLAG